MSDGDRPRLRDSARRFHELYPIGEIPDEIVHRFARHLTCLRAIGRKDIGGDDWGDAFAYAISGTHLASPLGVVDVAKGDEAWSTKTVKSTRPHDVASVRLISGRNSPNYSMGITDPHADIAATGRAVLAIWNERVNIALDQYKRLRTVVLVRNAERLEYTVFEEPTERFDANEFVWSKNTNGNFVGHHIGDPEGAPRFTWQPHGSQFTIHATVPPEARRFTIAEPSVMSREDVLSTIGYADSWVSIRDGR